MTPPGIYPETVRLVAQYLNHYATLGPVTHMIRLKYHIHYQLFSSVDIFVRSVVIYITIIITTNTNITFNVLLTVHHAMILGNCPT